ncbi:SDR family oxidoreductase [Dactylosporangium fulvum]|uniref:SDR family oxidoreductase n=1 Tax=Dactylosporangium fulvum TaxID=53359 RepID=A0ABY5WDW6_9ACTN|nr:SDR family oxidoreductase [Dactylosporangium fulvum]UWP86696.1 SDR family oxidoreductase [Dactylosporangium fulvum]
MGRFDNKVTLITGGGSGIGRAAALQLASEGARLSLVDISAKGLAVTAEEIEKASPGTEVITVTADVSSETDVERYVADTVAAYGRIDGFFNNAGIEGTQNLIQDTSTDEFDRVLSINLRGVFLGLKHVLAVMKEQGSGAVVNTASVGGIRGTGLQSPYATSKHGVVGLTRNAGVEYGQYGVSVNAIAPGAVLTPMVEEYLRQLDPDNPEEAARKFLSDNPMKRFATLDEVAHLIAFLLSGEAPFINAAVITIDGGQSYRY